MDIQAEKIELVKLLLDTDSPEIINQIKGVFISEEHEFYDDLPDHVKESIDRGLKDIENGHVRSHELVMHDFNVKYGLKD